ncbi:hypothetical protein [Ralstonia pseudosolanacearum]|uniref:hypothetical protein n=1 Tax=Ralstonia pseudosolanacearum TaxID=1310165 RepID=UPI0018D0EC80|nr:hypothetical protein [Ralstonia pseudosolanacearum]
MRIVDFDFQNKHGMCVAARSKGLKAPVPTVAARRWCFANGDGLSDRAPHIANVPDVFVDPWVKLACRAGNDPPQWREKMEKWAARGLQVADASPLADGWPNVLRDHDKISRPDAFPTAHAARASPRRGRERDSDRPRGGVDALTSAPGWPIPR